MTCKPYDGKKGKTYYYVVDTAPRGAPRKQVQRRGFRTKKSCESARNKELTERHEGTHVEPSRETTRAYLERWSVAVAHRWRPVTRARVAATIRLLSTELGDIQLGHLDALAIQAAYGRLLERQAPSTMQSHHTVFKDALRQAVRWKLLRENPAEGVSLPTPERSPIQAWSVQEQVRFLDANHDDRWYPLWVFLLDSGCRVGEALALSWDDLDLTTRYATIRRTMTRDEHHRPVVGTDTKTDASRRSLQLSVDTIAVLERHRTAHIGAAPVSESRSPNEVASKRPMSRVSLLRDDGSMPSPPGQSLNLVFPADDGLPPKHSTLWGALHRACVRAGVPPLSSHGLRKTMTTLWLEAGVAPSVVAARLGHKSVQMTLNVYTRVSRSWGEAGVETVQEYLRKEQERREGVG